MDGRVILRLISKKERRVWKWIKVAQNRDVQRVFVNKIVRRFVICKGEFILISRSTSGFSMTLLQSVCLSFSRLRTKEQNMLVFLETAF